jgi:hypothetical protein
MLPATLEAEAGGLHEYNCFRVSTGNIMRS